MIRRSIVLECAVCRVYSGLLSTEQGALVGFLKGFASLSAFCREVRMI